VSGKKVLYTKSFIAWKLKSPSNAGNLNSWQNALVSKQYQKE